VLATCLPLMLEAGYSATSTREHERIMGVFSSWRILSATSDLNVRATMLQHLLFDAGKGRAAGAFDIEVAAYALSYTLSGDRVAIVHYDEDYDHLHDVETRLLTRWVVPRGSVD
jgi:predicted nucleic acid-binding protein